MKRATLVIFAIQNLIKNFNPRPREEGDPAPARGSAKPKDFNPRPREEGDNILARPLTTKFLFQSTPS